MNKRIINIKRIIILLLLTISLNSCNQNFDYENYDITLANIFSVYGDEMEEDIIFLNEKINEKKSNMVHSPNEILDSLIIVIDDYYNYLNELDSKSEKLSQNIFYKEDVLLEDGKKFKIQSEIFLNQTNAIVKDKDLKEFFNYYFNTDDIVIEDELYINYLDYNYLGVPYPVFRYLIKKRKLELIFFKRQILDKYN